MLDRNAYRIVRGIGALQEARSEQQVYTGRCLPCKKHRHLRAGRADHGVKATRFGEGARASETAQSPNPQGGLSERSDQGPFFPRRKSAAGFNFLFTVCALKNIGVRGTQMNAAEWTRLSAITDRLGSLKQQAQAAAVAGDIDRATYFFGLIKTADEDRQRIVEGIFGDL